MGGDGDESSVPRDARRPVDATDAPGDGPGGAYVSVEAEVEADAAGDHASAAATEPAARVTPNAEPTPPPPAVGGYFQRAREAAAKTVQWAKGSVPAGGGGGGQPTEPPTAEPAARSDDESSRSAGSGIARRRNAAPGDENDKWEFMQDDDAIEAADVPERLRVHIGDPRRGERAGDLAVPDIFVLDGEAARRLDVWTVTLTDGGPAA